MPKNKNKDSDNIYFIFLRYVIIALLGLGNLAVFYIIFTPLTVYPVYYILKLFYQVSIENISLFVTGINSTIFQIDLVEACIAGAAYYLLFILNLSTSISLKKRIYSLLFSFISLLILNILRIIILSFMFVNQLAYFDITHKIFWYAVSTIFVIGIWFLTVYIFSIKKIPVYSDLQSILKIIRKH